MTHTVTLWMRHKTYRVVAHVIGVHGWHAAKQPRPRIRRLWRGMWTEVAAVMERVG